jgi:hypothetical protein
LWEYGGADTRGCVASWPRRLVSSSRDLPVRCGKALDQRGVSADIADAIGLTDLRLRQIPIDVALHTDLRTIPLRDVPVPPIVDLHGCHPWLTVEVESQHFESP